MAANAATASLRSELVKIENEIIECQPNSEFKTKYNQQLTEFYESQVSQMKKPWNRKRISEVIQYIKDGKVAMISGQKRTSMQYYWHSKYEIVISEKTKQEYLTIKKKKPGDPTIRIVPTEQYFDLIYEIHNRLDHAGRDKITSIVKNKYYVQKKGIELFVALCPTCDQKRNILRKKTATKLATANFNTHGLVDIIDLQDMPDGDYKWLLKYQDRATKFIHLRPLKTDEPLEIASELVKIFLTFGAPSILFSDENILKEIVKLWPQCEIFHGSSRPPSMDDLELSKKDVEVIFQTWMEDTASSNWSLGCYFIQYQMNTANNMSDDKSAYRQLFGTDPKSIKQGNSDPGDYVEVNILAHNNADNLGREKNSNVFSENVIHHSIIIKTEKEDDVESADETSQVFVQQGLVVKMEIEEDNCSAEHSTGKTISNKLSQVFDHHEINMKTENKKEEISGEETYIKNIHGDCDMDKTDKKDGNQGLKRPASETIAKKKQKKSISDLEVGNMVKISVPVSDRGPLDSPFITGKIIACHDGLYQVGTNAGILKNWFPSHELIKINQEMEEDIPGIQLLSFKQAVSEQTLRSQK